MTLCKACHVEPLTSDGRIALGLCPSCQKEAEEQDAEQIRIEELDEAETVEELKDWIKEYLL